MSAPVWKIFLANSSDMSLIGDLTHEAKSKSFQFALNKAGSFSFNLPLSTEFWNDLDPVQNCIIAQKNGVTVWSGPIWTKQETLHDAKISLSAVGWFQLLHKRVTLERLVYTSQRRGAIAMDLLARANSYQNTYVGIGPNTDTTSSALSIRTYEKYSNIGQEIEALSATEGGFDFKVDPVNRQLNISSSASYTDTDVVWGFGWGPHNVGQVTRSTDADEMANQIIATFSNADAVSGGPLESSAINYRLFQKVISISESPDSTYRNAIVNAEFAINQNPRTLISFTPRLYGPENVPSIFEDYDIGDKVYLTAKRDNVNIENQAVRVFSANVEIDNEGNEAVSNINVTSQASN